MRERGEEKGFVMSFWVVLITENFSTVIKLKEGDRIYPSCYS